MHEQKADKPRFNHVKTMLGPRVAEVISLNECRPLGSPIILRESRELPDWIHTNVTNEELITLPYVFSGAERWNKKTFIPYFQENTILHWEKNQPGVYQPVIISEISLAEERKFAILISEATDLPLKNSDPNIFYRFQDKLSIPSILKYGFYQLPGRLFARSIIEKAINEDFAPLMFTPPQKDMVIHDLNPLYMDIALKPSPEEIGENLPPELKAQIGDLLLFYGNSGQSFLELDTLGKQVLGWGQATGMLMKVEASRIKKVHFQTS